MVTSLPAPLLSAAAGLLDLVLPASCAGCGAPGADACAACAEPLLAVPHRSVPRPEPPGLVPVWTVADYGGPVRRLLGAWKEEGRAALTAPLADALAAAVVGLVDDALVRRPGALGGGVLVLVPAPSARAATRRRGRDPAGELARAAAARLRRSGLPARAAPLLVQARPLRDQAGLGARERAENLAGALRVPERRLAALHRRAPPAGGGEGRAPLAPATVVLVDDVLTTGATLAEAGRAVASTGLPVLGAATVAATARRLGAAQREVAAPDRPDRPGRTAPPGPHGPSGPPGAGHAAAGSRGRALR